MKELNKNFFNRDTTIVAKDLIGKILCVDDFRARITETEAYKQDKASMPTRRRKEAK